jgi:hypothetical protein
MGGIINRQDYDSAYTLMDKDGSGGLNKEELCLLIQKV